MTTLKLSEDGARFNAAHEGFVSRAYRCPAGVLTIGYGFTMRSRTFAEYWRKTRGHDLRMGDTVAEPEAIKLMRTMFDAEYGAAVNTKIGTRVQHQFDGSGSVSYNCGPGALDWKWAKALARGDVAQAARLLRTTAVTANGRRLAGLVRRRDEESDLIETGHYALRGSARQPAAVSQALAEVSEYQRHLATLGHYKGAVDGLAGPQTQASVKAFQKAAGLKADGVVGPATRAALIRALDAKRGGQAAGGAGAAGGAAGGGTELATQPTDALVDALLWGTVAIVVVGIVILIVKYRGVLTGRRVPT